MSNYSQESDMNCSPVKKKSYLSMNEINETIDIFNGLYTLNLSVGDFNCQGRIYYKWFPYPRIAFEGTITENSRIFFWASNSSEVGISIEGQCIGHGIVLEAEEGSGRIYGTSDLVTMNDSSIPVNEVSFPIINLRNHNGSSIRDPDMIGGYTGRITFEDDVYRITIDKNRDYKRRYERLRGDGGFIDTYTGRIAKKKGTITAGNIEDLIQCLSSFLNFFNGAICGIPIIQGINEDQVVWTTFRKSAVPSYRFVQTWSKVVMLDDLSVTWRRMRELWNDEDSKDVLLTSIHWYNQANSNSAGLEASIILSQTALELIYNWLLVEKRRILVGGDALKIEAANKIRLILSELNVDAKLPPIYDELTNINKDDSKLLNDGPKAFVFIRNALVHGNEEKRRELRSIPHKAFFEAAQLACWYIELCILYILGYSGKYSRRGPLRSICEEVVPWELPRKLH